jgi:4-alpha-glucanotransferase
VEHEGELLQKYALFSVLDQHFHRADPNVWIWQQWPEEYHDPKSEAVARFAATHRRALLFPMYVQWQLDVQAAEAHRHAHVRGLEIGLFHDLPLATDRCGFDLWANREFYVDGCRVGSPPDDFSPKGQDWSFPPPNTNAHLGDGYRLFAASIRKSARHGGALRIDHVMRLFRLYWIPDGFEASDGAYVRDYSEDLLRVLALESHREQLVIVGEDLGTVEPSMREALARFGILSYRLFYFEKNSQGGFKLPREYPAQALVSSTTHDLPTLAGFWLGRDIDARAAAGLLDDASLARQRSEREAEKQRMLEVLFELQLLPDYYPRRASHIPELTGEMHNAVTGLLARTPCLLLTINHEDLTKEPDQQNLPGTTWQYPNWRRKMRYSIEDLRSSQTALDFAAMFRHWLGKTGRGI